MKKALLILVFILAAFQITTAQEKKKMLIDEDITKKNVVMTWNKNTPEKEMQDDAKAIADYGVTIKYSNVKRNSKGEIIALKMEFQDRKGTKGKLELEGEKPISPIKFYKNGDEVGFGEPSNENDLFANNDFFNNFSGGDKFMKQFNFQDLNGENFNFLNQGDNPFFQSKSRIQIQKDGKKPLVIEDGKVIEGGDDYSQEEIDEIIKNNKVESFGNGKNYQFNFDSEKMDMNQLKEQFEKMQGKLQELYPESIEPKKESTSDELEKTKEEMQKAKEEMQKAKEELEKARKELEKAKSTLKMQKI
jgi:hypothetical protein